MSDYYCMKAPGLTRIVAPVDNCLCVTCHATKRIAKLQAELETSIAYGKEQKRKRLKDRDTNAKLQAEKTYAICWECGHTVKDRDAYAKLDCALATREMEAKEYCEIIDKLQAALNSWREEIRTCHPERCPCRICGDEPLEEVIKEVDSE